MHVGGHGLRRGRVLQKPVVESQMISLAVVVRDVLAREEAQVTVSRCRAARDRAADRSAMTSEVTTETTSFGQTSVFEWDSRLPVPLTHAPLWGSLWNGAQPR